MSFDLANLTIKRAHELIGDRKIKVVQLVEYYLEQIKKSESLNIVLHVCSEQALDKARKIDEKITSGRTIGLLEGIPYTAKDMFLTEGVPTTAASKILEGYLPPYSARVIEKLDDAGAILLAKVNQDEFAHGGSTENSAYGPTKNPLDDARVSGGSSGGSAAAVAADIGIFSLGTDTGGSIRQPASFCGVVGLKPTYGLVSRYGVVAMASSLDVIGPLARSVEDSAIVLEAIAGIDVSDATSIKIDDYDFTKQLSVAPEKLKIGIINQFINNLDETNRAVFNGSVEKLRSLNHEVIDIDLPKVDYSLPCYYIVTPSEISSNLERYDGVRYGVNSKSATSLDQSYGRTRGENFGPEVKRRILTGTYTLSAGYYDAYYKQAMRLRTMICQDFDQAFGKVDLLISPTTPTPAFKLGENSQDVIKMYQSDIMTAAVNLAGVPAISLPAGEVDNLPVGLQIIAPQKSESILLTFAHQIESSMEGSK